MDEDLKREIFVADMMRMPGDSQGFIRNEKANKLIEVN